MAVAGVRMTTTPLPPVAAASGPALDGASEMAMPTGTLAAAVAVAVAVAVAADVVAAVVVATAVAVVAAVVAAVAAVAAAVAAVASVAAAAPAPVDAARAPLGAGDGVGVAATSGPGPRLGGRSLHGEGEQLRTAIQRWAQPKGAWATLCAGHILYYMSRT